MMLFGIVKAQNNAMEPVKEKKKSTMLPVVREIGLGQHAKPTLLSFKMKERKIWTYGWMVVLPTRSNLLSISFILWVDKFLQVFV